MKHLAAAIILLVISISTDAPAGEKLIVTNERSGDVTIIDVDSKETLATIAVGKRPRGVRVSSDGKLAYVAVSATASAGAPDTRGGASATSKPTESAKSPEGIAVIDLAALKLIDLLPCGRDPENLSIVGQQLFISNEDDNAVTVIDVSSKRTIAKYIVGEEPEGVTTSPDGKLVYVTCESTNDVRVIDVTKTDANPVIITTAARPRAAAFTPDGRKAYITCESAGIVCVIDVATNKVIKQIKLDGDNVRPMGVAVSPDGKRAYIGAGRSGSVVVINTDRDETLGTVRDVGARAWGVATSTDGKLIFTANGPSNDISIIDAETLKVVTKLKSGGAPWGVAVAP